jgi:hypothetical protein
MIMDGAKEQVMGMFRRKCRETGIQVKQTERYTPWSNAAEAAIRELKKGVGRQMVRLKAPTKRLWDNCLEREAYVRSLTAHMHGPSILRVLMMRRKELLQSKVLIQWLP